MNTIPEAGFLRLKQILGDKKSSPPVPPIIPVSASTWWEGVKSGRFPKPLKLGPGTTVWRADDIRDLINQSHLKSGNEPKEAENEDDTQCRYDE